MTGYLNNNEIEEVLKHQLVGRLGCISDGVIYVVPISYAYDGSYIYSRAKGGMKINIMRKNPNVCFEVDTMQNMGNWKSVIAWGKFEEVIDENERNTGLQILMNRDLPAITSETVEICKDWPFPPKNLNEIDGIVFRIQLDIKTGRFEKKDPMPFHASF